MNDGCPGIALLATNQQPANYDTNTKPFQTPHAGQMFVSATFRIESRQNASGLFCSICSSAWLVVELDRSGVLVNAATGADLASQTAVQAVTPNQTKPNRKELLLTISEASVDSGACISLSGRP